MTTKELQKQVSELMDGQKALEQTRVVEIKTEKEIQRGLLWGLLANGDLCFLWIPNLAKDARNIENLDMDVVKVIRRYKPHQIMEIKKL